MGRWPRGGTWERVADRLRAIARVDAGHDAGKRTSGRKTFGVVDTLGLLIAVIAVFDAARTKTDRGREAVVQQRVQDLVRAPLPLPRR